MRQLVPEGSRQAATSPLHPRGQLLPARAGLILHGVAGSRSKMQHCLHPPARRDSGGDSPGLPGSCPQPRKEQMALHTLGTRQAVAQARGRRDNGINHRSRKSHWACGQNFALLGTRYCFNWTKVDGYLPARQIFWMPLYMLDSRGHRLLNWVTGFRASFRPNTWYTRGLAGSLEPAWLQGLCKSHSPLQ